MSKLLANSSFAHRFGLTSPIALAPMAFASGGELAAACAKAGALGLVGGAYGDLQWTQDQYLRATDLLASDKSARARVGCGVITWKLMEDRSALDWVLDQSDRPAAIMLSFGDPAPFSRDIIDRNISLICQIQNMAQVEEAVDAGASVIVAQGNEAGGHGLNSRDGRSSFTFVPELADWLARRAPDIDLLAAGGVSDGRGLAAAMMLGADGLLVGSRLWATEESLAAPQAIAAAVEASGDGTARSAVFDILRQKNWPEAFDFRALRNRIHRQWEDRIPELRANPGEAIADYSDGVAAGDYERAHVTVGEGTGSIHRVETAGQIIEDMNKTAISLLSDAKS